MDKKVLNDKKKSWLILCVAFSFMICIFGPLDTFLSNQTEFWFTFFQLLPVLLTVFVIVVAILFAIGLFVQKSKVGTHMYSLLFSLIIFFYIQGNYIPRNYGVLDGKEIQWTDYPGYAIASIILLIFSAILWVVACLKVKEKIYIAGRYLGVLLVLVQLVTIGALYIQNNILEGNINTNNKIVTQKDMLELSADSNIIVLLLDAFDSTDFQILLNGENSERYKGLFSDFVYYPNTSGAYPTTKGSLPYILSGKWYENEQPYATYVDEAYVNNEIYMALDEGDYSVGIYTSSIYLGSDFDLPVNVEEGKYKIANYLSFVGKIYKLVAFNYMPHQIKKFFWVNTDEFSDLKISSIDSAAFSSDVQKFDELIREQGISISKTGKCFRFYHLNGTHVPYTFDENLVSDPSQTYDVYDEAAGNCTLLQHFFDELREESVYDDTTIIVMADHGHLGYNQNPLFMIKNKGENHDFTISDQIISYEFLADIFVSLAHEEKIDEEYIRNCQFDNGFRRFLFYSWDDSWDKQYLPEILEMSVEGDARYITGLTYTGNVYWADGDSSDYKYEIGEVLSFAEEDTVSKHCIYGFSQTDGTGIWTSARNALMGFNLTGEYENLIMELEYAHVSTSSQEVIVYANGVEVADVVASDEGRIKIVIPREYIEDDYLKLGFDFPDAISPMDRGINNDQRILGLYLQSITLISTYETFDLLSQIKGSYFLGTELSFAKNNATANEYCLSGFSDNEENLTWTDGDTAQMLFIINEDFENLLLKLDYGMYLPQQEVIIYVNDWLVADYIATGVEEKRNFIIPGEYVQDGKLIVTFYLPDAIPPKSRGEGEDSRALGLAMKSISLSATDEMDFRNYELGTALSFAGDNETVERYCLSGFSESEGTHTWIDGKEAELQFSISGEYKDLVLNLDYFTHTNNQHVIIYANDHVIADYQASGEEIKTVSIPKEYIENGSLRLKFDLPDAASPLDLGESNDERVLGLAMKSLTILEADE